MVHAGGYPGGHICPARVNYLAKDCLKHIDCSEPPETTHPAVILPNFRTGPTQRLFANVAR